jgi:hypothetical protein
MKGIAYAAVLILCIVVFAIAIIKSVMWAAVLMGLCLGLTIGTILIDD